MNKNFNEKKIIFTATLYTFVNAFLDALFNAMVWNLAKNLNFFVMQRTIQHHTSNLFQGQILVIRAVPTPFQICTSQTQNMKKKVTINPEKLSYAEIISIQEH